MRIYTDVKNYANWIPEAEFSPLQDAELVLFTGGEDVHPSFYNEPKGNKTYTDKFRDDVEKRVYDQALELGIPMLGICRGAQFLTVMNGGSLIQHVTNHAGTLHPIITIDKKVYTVNSTHHQMMYPYGLPEEDYQVLAWSEGLSDTYLNGYNEEMVDQTDERYLGKALNSMQLAEPEIVFYPKTKCLCIQSHPEMRGFPVETTEYLKSLLNLIL